MKLLKKEAMQIKYLKLLPLLFLKTFGAKNNFDSGYNTKQWSKLHVCKIHRSKTQYYFVFFNLKLVNLNIFWIAILFLGM